MRISIAMALAALMLNLPLSPANAEIADQLLWGDTHLHSSYSPDAFLFGNRSADPDTAYRFAKGLPIIHPYHRARVQIATPLDFLVVSDHAEMMGIPRSLMNRDKRLAEGEQANRMANLIESGRGFAVFAELLAGVSNSGASPKALQVNEVLSDNWREITDAAERHNVPGQFSALIGWEWSSAPNDANLHRVVITPTDARTAQQFMPYSSLQSHRPEDLWQWLDLTSKKLAIDFIAIPHNSNVSKGLMFPVIDSDGKPLDIAHIQQRLKWEPIVEVTQIKGDSETHPRLSPDDEFADFERFRSLLAFSSADATPTTTPADYARAALRRGLEFHAKTGLNPYQFGLIGSTDSHTGAASAEEDNFLGKIGIDSIPENKSAASIAAGSGEPNTNLTMTGWDMSSSGLAAVWAEENTRDAIFAALRRREVYATTGPRISVRFFGGWNFKTRDSRARNIADLGYRKGVPMGSVLKYQAGAPSFLIAAGKDPNHANLDRVQVVKGWLDAAGQTHEKIYNVVFAGDGRKNKDGRLVPIGNTVDTATGNYQNTIGATQLATVWKDPDFNAEQLAFYYVRVLQIPTPRNSLYDSLALNTSPPPGYPTSIQERAYTSPIWYMPSAIK